MYPEEFLGSEDDDGTMVNSLEDFRQAVVGHRIVKFEADCGDGLLTLDNRRTVRMIGGNDCCAFTELQAFLLHPERVNHMIMGVGTTEEYQKWHIYCDYGDILELTVGWSCGNPFYYGYGFSITVDDPPGPPPVAEVVRATTELDRILNS